MTVGANYAFFSVLRRGLAALIPADVTSPIRVSTFRSPSRPVAHP